MKKVLIGGILALAALAMAQPPPGNGRWNIAASNGTNPNAVNANFYAVDVNASTARPDVIYGRANFTTGVICVYPSKSLRNAADTTTALACATGITNALPNSQRILTARRGSGVSVTVTWYKKFLLSGVYDWDVVTNNISKSMVDSMARAGYSFLRVDTITSTNAGADSIGVTVFLDSTRFRKPVQMISGAEGNVEFMLETDGSISVRDGSIESRTAESARVTAVGAVQRLRLRATYDATPGGRGAVIASECSGAALPCLPMYITTGRAGITRILIDTNGLDGVMYLGGNVWNNRNVTISTSSADTANPSGYRLFIPKGGMRADSARFTLARIDSTIAIKTGSLNATTIGIAGGVPTASFTFVNNGGTYSIGGNGVGTYGVGIPGAANYERGRLVHDGTTLSIYSDALGTGTAAGIDITVGPTNRARFTLAGAIELQGAVTINSGGVGGGLTVAAGAVRVSAEAGGGARYACFDNDGDIISSGLPCI